MLTRDSSTGGGGGIAGRGGGPRVPESVPTRLGGAYPWGGVYRSGGRGGTGTLYECTGDWVQCPEAVSMGATTGGWTG